MMTAKAEALDALQHMKKMLADPAPLVGVRMVVFTSTLEYAEERVNAIVEVQRIRKSRAEGSS
jgi:hypothetical protein